MDKIQLLFGTYMRDYSKLQTSFVVIVIIIAFSESILISNQCLPLGDPTELPTSICKLKCYILFILSCPCNLSPRFPCLAPVQSFL